MDHVSRASIKWGIGGVTITIEGKVICLDYIDLIHSFLKVDAKTRAKVGDLVLGVLRMVKRK